jgi:hypothetical protein
VLQTTRNRRYMEEISWRQEVRQNTMTRHCRSKRIYEQSQCSQGRGQKNPRGIRLSQGVIPSSFFEQETLAHIVIREDIVRIVVGGCIQSCDTQQSLKGPSKRRMLQRTKGHCRGEERRWKRTSGECYKEVEE